MSDEDAISDLNLKERVVPNEEDNYERVEIDKYCKGYLYKLVRSNYKLMIYLSLIKSNCSNDLNKVKLVYDNPFKRKFSCKMILLCYIIYSSIKYTLVSIAQVIFDQYRERYSYEYSFVQLKKYDNTLNQTDKCILKEDIDLLQSQMIHKIQILTNFLYLSGYPILSVRGIASGSLIILASIPYIYILSTIIFVDRHKINNDVCDFILNPIKEISKTQIELRRIELNLIKTIKTEHILNNKHNDNIMIDNNKVIIISTKNKTTNQFDNRSEFNLTPNKFRCNNNNQQIIDFKLINSTQQEAAQQDDEFGCNYFRRRSYSMNNKSSNETTIESSNFYKAQDHIIMFELYTKYDTMSQFRVLLNIHLFNQVKLNNMNSKWFAYLIKINGITHICNMIGHIICSLLFILILYQELYLRAEHRINLFKCQQWNPESIINDFSINLLPLNDTYEVEAYLNYNNGSHKSLLDLTLIEAKYFSTKIHVIISTIELFILVVLITNWIEFYFLTFLNSHLHKRIWVKQINKDVDYCINLIRQHDRNHIKHNNIDGHLLTSITKAYINFELFRKKHTSYQTFMNFLLFQISLVTIIQIAGCYLVGKSLEKNQSVIILSQATIVVYCMNIFLITAALVSSDITKLMNSITKLVILSGSLEYMSNSLIMDLWRRQLMDPYDLKILYAPCFLNVYLSYSRLLTIDTWLLIMWYMLVIGK